jgi:hypothetical protein
MAKSKRKRAPKTVLKLLDFLDIASRTTIDVTLASLGSNYAPMPSFLNYCGGGGGANKRFWIMNGPAFSSTTL